MGDGVKVNSADAEGRTGLHVATANNDVDGICRLIEWGADINLKDKKGRTPLHAASIGGHYNVAMLLLELGADLNAKDDKDYPAVAHAEANDNFTLWERLIKLGGRRLQEPRGHDWSGHAAQVHAQVGEPHAARAAPGASAVRCRSHHPFCPFLPRRSPVAMSC